MLYYTPVFAFLITLLLTTVILSTKVGRQIQDIPNERSLHQVPVPRVGGLALMAGMLAGWGLMWQSWLLPVTLGVLFLMLVSFVDDLRGLPAAWRFLMHFLVAAVFVWTMLLPGSDWWLFILLVLVMVWMTNLYNFMDGSDGLAGGMALFGFGSYGAASWLAGDDAMALVSLSIAAAALAFLRFNFHPARIFMGDAGSIPLGFLSAALGLFGWQRGLWPLWFPLVVFSPFVVDASVTLLRRLLRGKKIWQAHREHYYQRLVQMGWGHRDTAWLEYALMMSLGIIATGLLHAAPEVQQVALCALALFYVALAWLIDRACRANIVVLSR